VLLLLAALSLPIRRERPASLGLHRCAHAGRMVAQVALLTAGWTVLQFAVFLPLLNHVTGEHQDLSDFSDLEGHLGTLVIFIALSWTLAAFGEELAYRGYLLTRFIDLFGPARAGVIASIGLSSVLFGLAHTEQGLIGVLATTLDAVFFCVLRRRYDDSIWAPFIAHGLNNTIGLTAFYVVGPVYGLW
jgi:membrane protease YdiL (CAAX protease family)